MRPLSRNSRTSSNEKGRISTLSSEPLDLARWVDLEPPALHRAVQGLPQDLQDDVHAPVGELPLPGRLLRARRDRRGRLGILGRCPLQVGDEGLDVLLGDVRDAPVAEEGDELALDDPAAVVGSAGADARRLVLEPPQHVVLELRRPLLGRRGEEGRAGAAGEPLSVLEGPGRDLAVDLAHAASNLRTMLRGVGQVRRLPAADPAVPEIDMELPTSDPERRHLAALGRSAGEPRLEATICAPLLLRSRALIPDLLTRGSPPAVAGLVVPVIVLPVDGFTGRALAHVGEEVPEVLAPAFADHGAASAVTAPVWGASIQATLLHHRPGPICRRHALSVSMPDVRPTRPLAPARCSW